MKIEDFIEINPSVNLNKGEEYPFVAIENIFPFKRYVETNNFKVYKGNGSKFLTNDILFARITPCLENGKIAQYVSEKTQKGFGSTELFVFRAKEGVSIPAFVYYIAVSDIIRGPAIKSMFGTSGRQRADLTCIKNIEIHNYTLSTQRKIASILSAYDDLIENNLKRIKILEEMAQMIYREWFVKFRFPGHEKVKMVNSELGMIPEGWEVKRLGESSSITMGQSPSSKLYNTNFIGLPFHQGVKDFGFRFPIHKVYCSGNHRIAEKGDILISVRAPVGRLNIANTRIIIGRGLASIKHNRDSQSFLFYQLKSIFSVEDAIGSGTIYKAITKDDLQGIKCLIPNGNLAGKFNKVASSIDFEIECLSNKNSLLRQTRDLLLSKLISGEIDVEDLDIAID